MQRIQSTRPEGRGRSQHALLFALAFCLERLIFGLAVAAAFVGPIAAFLAVGYLSDVANQRGCSTRPMPDRPHYCVEPQERRPG